MSAPPRVSVAVATCNGARYLREQLDSIYGQTWPDLEVVASDDASTDGTAEILEEYARTRGLRWVAQPQRLGLARNFERAIALCRGDFIALSDQDDVWKPHKLATLVGQIGDFTLIYCSTQDFLTAGGEHRHEEALTPVRRFATLHGTGRPTRFLLAENWVVSHSLLFKRELVEHALPIPPHQLFHDGWLALIACKLGGVKFLDEGLQCFREHPGSMTYPASNGGRRGLGPLSTLRESWARRCRSETARLTDALAHPLLDGDDRAFVQELLTYYGSGLRGGLRWDSFRSGLEVAPYVHTLYPNGSPRRFALRALIGGLVAGGPA